MADTDTSRLYLKNVLESNWQSSITDRIIDVPKPDGFLMESDPDNTRVNLQNGDYVFFVKGQAQTVEPRSLYWTAEGSENYVTIDIRTSKSLERLRGTRDANNDAERYGGLRGEVKRLLDTIRRGEKEFDIVAGYEWRDLSDEMGFGFWRGVWEVRLEQVAVEIDTTP